MSVADPPGSAESRHKESVDTVVIRFCGDSGDGMQLAGTQFTNVSAIFGNDVSHGEVLTLPAALLSQLVDKIRRAKTI